MKSFVLALFCLFMTSSIDAQLIMKNNFDKPYKIAFALYSQGDIFSRWVSKGWVTVQPGEEKEVFYTNPREKYIYYIAISENDTIGGFKKGLVNPDEETFTIKNAFLDVTKEENPNLKWLNFKEVRRGFITKFNKKLVITIGE